MLHKMSSGAKIKIVLSFFTILYPNMLSSIKKAKQLSLKVFAPKGILCKQILRGSRTCHVCIA